MTDRQRSVAENVERRRGLTGGAPAGATGTGDLRDNKTA
jgi:hypothetical protein